MAVVSSSHAPLSGHTHNSLSLALTYTDHSQVTMDTAVYLSFFLPVCLSLSPCRDLQVKPLPTGRS